MIQRLPVHLVLKRLYQDAFGMHGELYCGTTLLCYTLEPPDLGNQSNVSCIPAKIYHCSPHSSLDHPHTWQINDVEGRTNVLMHAGNWLKNTLGCILVGMIKLKDGVGQSESAMNMLRGFLPDEFSLEIVAVKPATNSAPLNA